MNKLNVIALSVVTVPLLATSAIAGSTSNTITNGVENGTRKVKVDSVRTEHGRFDRETFNVKIDAVGEVAGTQIRYDGKKFTGSGFANNIENPDPFVNAGTVSNREWGSFRQVDTVKVREDVNFTNTSIDFTLTTGF